MWLNIIITNYNIRLRIIAGNKCKNTTLTANLLAYEQNTCTGHEDISGIDTNKVWSIN